MCKSCIISGSKLDLYEDFNFYFRGHEINYPAIRSILHVAVSSKHQSEMYYNNITKTWELQLDAKFFQMTKGLWSKIMEDNNF